MSSVTACVMPATGVLAPDLMLVAVRAIAPVATEERRQHVRDALRRQFNVGIVPIPGHAVGDDGRQQGFNRSEHRDGQRW